MAAAKIPHDEARRLEALDSYCVLDTGAELAFDEIVRLAAEICETPMALVSLIDRDREFLKAVVGSSLRESPRDVSFCGHGILEHDVFVVRDALQDERFADNPNVLAGPRIRYYAGVSLVTPAGYTVGMLCVKDTLPRDLSGRQLGALKTLGHQVVAQLELRKSLAESRSEAEELRRVSSRYEALFDGMGEGVITMSVEGRITHANRAACRKLGYGEHELAGRDAHCLFFGRADSDGVAWPVLQERAIRHNHQALLVRRDGSRFEVEYSTIPVPVDDDLACVMLRFRDISRKRAIERELHRTQALYEAAVGSSA